LMAAKIMNIPPDVPGVLVECGCFKGGSTANLSLVAAACGRTLHVFDSFAGLPTPDEIDDSHLIVADMELRTYEKGDYFGALDEVRENVRRFGALDACEFHVGYFEDSFPSFHEAVVFAFLDVDLVSSEATCLRYIWPLLANGGRVFTDEAQHHAIAQLFYDSQWWRQEMGTAPPGLVGAGSGLGLMIQAGGFRSSLGYTVKIEDPDIVLERRPG
jgi:O-methyltransferase